MNYVDPALRREIFGWHSPRLGLDMPIVRYGHFGRALLLLPTASGDFLEAERMWLIKSVEPLLLAGRVTVFSIDSINRHAWMNDQVGTAEAARRQALYSGYIEEEVVPHIRRDCHDERIEIVATGASMGAFNAVAALCRHPDVFRLAIGMSGTYDLTRFLGGTFNQDFYFSSPLHYLPGLEESPQLAKLRERFVLLATGEGAYEDPGESWRLAHVLGAKGIPNRVELWGRDHPHDWSTWRAMLPRYLGELV